MAEHVRFIQRMYHLLQDCGCPEQLPDASLIIELFFMIEEHCEMLGVDLE